MRKKFLEEEMSREYLIFDRSGCSERKIVFHDRDFSISAFEIDEFELPGNGFKEAMVSMGIVALKNAKLSRGLSMPLLQEEVESSWDSSASSPVIASTPNQIQQQQQVEMADEEGSICYSGEEGDDLDVLLNLEDKLADTADSVEVPDHRSQRIRETFKMLRDLVGGDSMDAIDVLDEAIRFVKRLEMDVKNLKNM